MKYLHLTLSVVYIALAFYLAWQIDIEDSHKFTASSCLMLGVLAAFRFQSFIEYAKKKKQNARES